MDDFFGKPQKGVIVTSMFPREAHIEIVVQEYFIFDMKT